MPDLQFKIDGAEPVAYAASPQLAFKLLLTEPIAAPHPPASIHSILLRCQIRIEPARRRYTPAEQRRLLELFGQPHRWGQTVRSMLWTNISPTIPPFTGQTRFDLLVPCTCDFAIAATKYFAALQAGDIPLSFLFSGTIFYAAPDAALQVEQISWEKEVDFRLDAAVWRNLMDLYYPNTAFLPLHQDVFDRLQHYRIARAMPTAQQAIESLLAEAESLPASDTNP